MRSPVYWHPRVYAGAMRLLYGRYYQVRYAEIARRIEPGASVVDLCCGDSRLFTQELNGRGGSYIGLDFNEAFVRHARRLGIQAEQWDGRCDSIPAADVVVLQGSLYQFIPNHDGLIDRMLAAAQRAVIIAEPVRNMASSSSRLLSWMAAHLTNPGSRPMPIRFIEAELDDLFKKFGARECVVIAGGRELLAVLEPRRRRP